MQLIDNNNTYTEKPAAPLQGMEEGSLICLLCITPQTHPDKSSIYSNTLLPDAGSVFNAPSVNFEGADP